MILVPQKAVEKFLKWNEPPKRADKTYDRKTCFTWLLSLVDRNAFAAFDIDSEIVDFIRGKYLYSLFIFFVVFIF